MKKAFKNDLDIHSRGKSDKNVVFDVVTSCSIFDKYFFEEYFLILVVDYAFICLLDLILYTCQSSLFQL